MVPEARQVILIVDDEPDILASLASLVEVCLPEVRVLTAASGDEALRRIGAHDIDLLVTDFKMPGMDGLELMARAELLAPGVPRVLITAFPTLDLAVKAINQVRVDRFLTKPFKVEDVVNVIAELLHRRLQQRQQERLLGSAESRRPRAV